MLLNIEIILCNAASLCSVSVSLESDGYQPLGCSVGGRELGGKQTQQSMETLINDDDE